MKRLSLILLITMLLVGCSSNKEKITNNEVSEGSYIIKPTSLFQSKELKKLEPHLDIRTGCVEIQYKGDKERLKTKYEVWKNGELETSNENFGVSISYNNEEKEVYTGSIGISIKDNLLLDNSKPSEDMIMTTAIEGSSVRQIIDRYGIGYSSAEFHLRDSIESKDSEEVAIWALIGIDDRKNKGYSPELTIEETVKGVDWALVVKVYFE